MLDLTGENLATYLLRELKDVVNRNPRFKSLGGETFVQASNLIQWGDLQVQISNVSASGNRLSPDYFMCTQHGHSVLAKLQGHDGVFVDWVQENQVLTNTPKTSSTLIYPQPGVYYLNVDSVDEGTREVGLTVQTYTWSTGKTGYGVGSGVYFSPLIDPTTVYTVDPTISFIIQGGILYVTSYTTQQPLQLRTASGILTPNVDFWYVRQPSYVICESTFTGTQTVTLPVSSYSNLVITDQDGYELRSGIDYQFTSTTTVVLQQFTPPGSTLTGTFTVQADPSVTPVVQSENMLPIPPLSPSELMAAGQVVVRSTFGPVYTESDLVVAGDGTIWLKNLLRPGEKVFWEVRVNSGQSSMMAKKLAANKNIINGLTVGIGDMVTVGDQCVIMVSPNLTETYEVYGSKENVSFEIRVKANDRLTASDISSMIRSFLLVQGRENMEANGLTIFEISRASMTEPKDMSGVTPSTTFTLTVSAAADWEYYLPLITRIGYFTIQIGGPTDGFTTDFPGKPEVLPRLTALGSALFVPYYA
jgi:hypothetical protein